MCLGKQLKYSCCLYPQLRTSTLDDAEDTMLGELSIEFAKLDQIDKD